MKLRTLKSYLKDIRNEGFASYTMNFSDQDCDYYTITNIYEDEDGDICLEAGDGFNMNVYDILDNLKGYRGDSYVYVYAPCDDISFDIEGGWYFDNNSDLTMDMHYSYDDDDDDDRPSYFSRPWNICPKCHSIYINADCDSNGNFTCECTECGFRYASDDL